MGGTAGAVIGHEVDSHNHYHGYYGHSDGTAGAVVGGAAGAVIGYAVGSAAC